MQVCVGGGVEGGRVVAAPRAPPVLRTGSTSLCSGSEAGSYLRLIDFVYHSTLGLRVIKKKRTGSTSAREHLGASSLVCGQGIQYRLNVHLGIHVCYDAPIYTRTVLEVICHA